MSRGLQRNKRHLPDYFDDSNLCWLRSGKNRYRVPLSAVSREEASFKLPSLGKVNWRFFIPGKHFLTKGSKSLGLRDQARRPSRSLSLRKKSRGNSTRVFSIYFSTSLISSSCIKIQSEKFFKPPSKEGAFHSTPKTLKYSVLLRSYLFSDELQ